MDRLILALSAIIRCSAFSHPQAHAGISSRAHFCHKRSGILRLGARLSIHYRPKAMPSKSCTWRRIFPAMLGPWHREKDHQLQGLTSFIRMKSAAPFARTLRAAWAGVEVRVLLDGVGSGWSLNNSDVRMMKRAGCRFTYYHRRIREWTGPISAVTGASWWWTDESDSPAGWFAKHWSEYSGYSTGAMCAVRRPLVAKLQSAFRNTGRKPGEELSSADQFRATAAGNIKAQIVSSRSFYPLIAGASGALPPPTNGSGSRPVPQHPIKWNR